jgi:hypothetical protein
LPTTEPSLWQALASAISGKETNLKDFNEEQIVTQANLHGVSQLLNKQVYDGTVSGLSETAKKQLKSLSYTNAAFDLILNSATEKLLNLLAEHEIPALLLKGTPIAHLYFPGTHLRPRCDSDIYINERDLDKTATLLTSNKYQLSGLGKRKYSSKQFVATLTPFKNCFVHFDMHWKLSNRVMFRSTLPFEECLETSQPVPKLGPNARALSITDLMLHACIHRIAHGRNTERNRLIWLYDIHLLAGAMNEAEMDHFLLAARQKAVGYLCADALGVCQTIFSTALPKNTLTLLKENHRNEPSAKLLRSSKLRWAIADMQSLKDIRQKVAFAKELLFG